MVNITYYILFILASTIPIYKSNKGFINGTSVTFTSNYTANQTLVWEDNSPSVILGTYNTRLSLSLATK